MAHEHPHEHEETRQAELSEFDLHHGEQADRISYTTKRTESMGGPFRDDGLTPEEMVNHPDIQGVYPFQEADESSREQGHEAFERAAAADEVTDEDVTYGGMGEGVPGAGWQGEPHEPSA